MDDAFGHWLAGFTDGEGAFVIARVSSRNGNPNHLVWPNCRYQIHLRFDDCDILRTIRNTLGFGSVYARQSTGARPNTQPSARYSVHRIGDCLKVVQLFHRYSLRAKKRAQFLVWADAVHEMAKGRDRSNAFIEECRAKLAALRKYVQPEALEAYRDSNPPLLKHHREYGTPPPCQCGCGQATRVLSHSASVPHPTNPNYCAFVRGHNRRVLSA